MAWKAGDDPSPAICFGNSQLPLDSGPGARPLVDVVQRMACFGRFGLAAFGFCVASREFGKATVVVGNEAGQTSDSKNSLVTISAATARRASPPHAAMT
jgi:hypothetical protein